MAIVKHDIEHAGIDWKHAGIDWLIGAAFLAAVLLLVWLAQFVATAIIYLGEMVM
ncbi:hypothetical protein Q5H91_03745 [Sphingomonas sp. KR1UV-12]|uniref:Uncharacterized protein n=1 Tax=Sphingomonas aurea TaxID=3063994 RepID=A0ABT9EHD0_9SPHN|nr:hypothetical protein [Sphingomonas sp. KR1UV-12]MDP1026314.1 hypothetical protein [Sphingomonas sp. KR1UV-12]